MSEKLTKEFLISVKGIVEPNGETNNYDVKIDLQGYLTHLRSGIIKAMKQSDTFAELVIDAAEYFKNNAQNFEYNK